MLERLEKIQGKVLRRILSPPESTPLWEILKETGKEIGHKDRKDSKKDWIKTRKCKNKKKCTEESN